MNCVRMTVSAMKSNIILTSGDSEGAAGYKPAAPDYISPGNPRRHRQDWQSHLQPWNGRRAEYRQQASADY